MKYELIPLACGFLGFALVLLYTSSHGAGITFDSIYYLSLASNLAVGNGFTEFDASGRASTMWPPLFPALLAAGEFAGWKALDVVRWINAIAFGLVGYLGSRVLTRSGLSPLGLVVIAGSLAVVLFKPGAYTSAHAWAEPLFILFALLSLLCFGEYRNSQRWRAVILAATFAALASLTRYVGVTVIATGLLLLLADLWFARRREENRVRLKAAQTAAYACLAAAPLALWLFRNLLVSGTLAGGRGPSRRDLLENVQLGFEGLGIWMLPTDKQLRMLAEKATPAQALVDSWGYDAIVATAGALLLLLAMGAVVFPGSAWRWRNHVTGGPAAPFAVFTLCYLTFMVVSASVIAYSPLIDHGARLLVPVYVPLVLMSVVALAALWQGMKRGGGGPDIHRRLLSGLRSQCPRVERTPCRPRSCSRIGVNPGVQSEVRVGAVHPGESAVL